YFSIPLTLRRQSSRSALARHFFSRQVCSHNAALPMADPTPPTAASAELFYDPAAPLATPALPAHGVADCKLPAAPAPAQRAAPSAPSSFTTASPPPAWPAPSAPTTPPAPTAPAAPSAPPSASPPPVDAKTWARITPGATALMCLGTVFRVSVNA